MNNMNRWLIVMVITGIISTTAQGAEEATPEEAAAYAQRREREIMALRAIAEVNASRYRAENEVRAGAVKGLDEDETDQQLFQAAIEESLKKPQSRQAAQKKRVTASEPLNLPVMEGRDPGWYRGDQGVNALKLGQSEFPSALAELVGNYTQSLWVDKDVKIKSQVLRGHTNWVRSVAISPDNSFIVTASYDGRARTWNRDGTPRLADGQQIVLAGHTGSVISVAISPDSSFIVTGSRDGIARIWNTDGTPRLNADQEQIVLAGHTGFVISVAISPDNKFIVTGSDDSTARIWNAQTGAELHTLVGHTDGVSSVAISPDNKFIVTGSYDDTVKIWDVETGAVRNTLSGHTDSVNSVAISPDSSFIVTGSGDGTTRIWNRQTGAMRHTLMGHTYPIPPIFSVAISPDSSFIVTGSGDSTARIWDVETRSVLNTLSGHTDPILSVAISPDSSFIVTGSSDGTARIWRPVLGAQALNVFDRQLYDVKKTKNRMNINLQQRALDIKLLIEINKLVPMEAGPEIDTQEIVTTIKSLLESGANPQSIQKDRLGNKKSIIDIASDLLNEDYPEIMTLLRENRSSIGGRIQRSGVVEKFQEMMGGRSSDKK